MAYRKLEIGDRVKIVKCGDWSGAFGEVLTTEGDFYKVRFYSWKDNCHLTHYFTSDRLLVSSLSQSPHVELPDEDVNDVEGWELEEDDELYRGNLLERIVKLEKEIVDLKKQLA